MGRVRELAFPVDVEYRPELPLPWRATVAGFDIESMHINLNGAVAMCLEAIAGHLRTQKDPLIRVSTWGATHG